MTGGNNEDATEKGNDKDGQTKPNEGDGSNDKTATDNTLKPPAGATKNTKPSSKSSRKSVDAKGAKLKMPSTQAGFFTRKVNRLLELCEKQNAEDIVETALKEAEAELETLKKQVNLVLPIDVPQQKFKDEWWIKNVAEKEAQVTKVRRALEAVRHRDRSSSHSVSSSVRHAAILAEEEEAKLLLKQQQLQTLHAERRRQREQEARLREKEEEDKLERRLQGVRVRREALHRAMSVRSGRSSRSSDIELLPALPQREQLTSEWLQAARDQATPTRHLMQHRGDANQVNQRGTPSAAQSASDVQTQLLQHLILAQSNLPTFDGDPMEYMWFNKAFTQQIDSVTSDAQKKLHILMEHLQGEPRTLVKGCQLDPQRGYLRARALLDERYGDPTRQALLLLSKLLNWPTVKGPKDLAGFSVHLQLCQEVKVASPEADLSELDAPQIIFKLATKLSSKMQGSWQVRAVDIETNTQRKANFDDFVSFVKRLEKARNHPVYGRLDVDRREDTRSSHQSKVLLTAAEEVPAPLIAPSCQNVEAEREGQSALQRDLEETCVATSVPANQPSDAFKPPCLICKDSHPTSRCTKAQSTARDQKLEALRGLCFACLRSGHHARVCRTRLKCDVCNGLHPTILHERGEETQDARQTRRSEQSTATNIKSVDNVANVALAVIPVLVWHPSKKTNVVVRALLDPASTATFVAQRVVDVLEATAMPVSLALATMSGTETVEVGVAQGLLVSSLETEELVKVPSAYVVDQLPISDGPISEDDLQRWAHLRGLPVNLEYQKQPVEMLIGVNSPKAIRPIEVVDAGDFDPYAVRTALGWVVQGPLKTVDSQSPHQAKVNWVNSEEIAKRLETLHYADFEGLHDFTTKGLSQEDRQWLAQTEASVARQNGHYVVDLPLCANASTALHGNYVQARARLTSLARKFRLNEQFRQDNVAFMNKMIEAQHAELVPDEESNPSAGGGDFVNAAAEERGKNVINYVPHHGVYHPRKPGKIRVVFNCASKYRGTALNDCLSPGPDLTNSIVSVLLRFRLHRVAFMADVEAMFYQVIVPERQRDALRFLWWPQGDTSLEPATYRMKVHLFGATSSPSVANFALRKAAQDAFAAGKISEIACQAVEQNFYVDDCLRSAETEEEAAQIAQELVTACSYGGFRLTKFLATSMTLLETLEETEWAKGIAEVKLTDDKTDPLGSLQERALGVAWDVKQDCFKFRLKKEPSAGTTKRAILAQLSRVYDPIGFAAPVLIVARMLFRRLTG